MSSGHASGSHEETPRRRLVRQHLVRLLSETNAKQPQSRVNHRKPGFRWHAHQQLGYVVRALQTSEAKAGPPREMHTFRTAVTWYPQDINTHENMDTDVRWKFGELYTTARRPAPRVFCRNRAFPWKRGS